MPEKSNQPQEKPENKPSKKPYYKKRYYQKPPKKKFWNADKIVSLSAMAIALFTLLVLVYQSTILSRQYDLTEKQQKASVLPHVMILQNFDPTHYNIVLLNQGLGPAFIKGFYLQQNDSIFAISNMYDIYFRMTDNASDSLVNSSYASLFDGRVIAAGEEIEIISNVGETEGIKPIFNFYNNYFENDEFKVIVEYESVFEEGWVVESTYQIFPKKEYGEIDAH